MPRLSKLLEKLEDRIANKWGRWYERNKARAPLYAVLGGIGWYLYGMFLNSLKLGKESVFNTTGEVIESIWVFNPFKNLFAVFTPFGIGVTAFIALMVCLITKKGYSWFSGYPISKSIFSKYSRSLSTCVSASSMLWCRPITVHRESKLTKGAWRSCFARCAQAPIMSGCGVMWFLTETAG